MKEVYERASIEIIRFDSCTADIITESGDTPIPETDDD